MANFLIPWDLVGRISSARESWLAPISLRIQGAKTGRAGKMWRWDSATLGGVSSNLGTFWMLGNQQETKHVGLRFLGNQHIEALSSQTLGTATDAQLRIRRSKGFGISSLVTSLDGQTFMLAQDSRRHSQRSNSPRARWSAHSADFMEGRSQQNIRITTWVWLKIK